MVASLALLVVVVTSSVSGVGVLAAERGVQSVDGPVTGDQSQATGDVDAQAADSVAARADDDDDDESDESSRSTAETPDATLPPDPQHGFSETDIAVLFSRDADTGDSGGDETLGQLANATDLTYATPPTTARRWTAQDFFDLNQRTSGDLDLRDPNTSYYPPSASTTSEQGEFEYEGEGIFTRGPTRVRVVDDAHVTMFSIQPSTVMHVDDSDPVFYVKHEGKTRVLVDYRAVTPDGQDQSVPGGKREGEATDIEWTLQESEVVNTTMYVNDSADKMVLEETFEGYNHTPVFEYDRLYGWRTVGYSANISLTYERTVTVTEKSCHYDIEYDDDEPDGVDDDGDGDKDDKDDWHLVKRCGTSTESKTEEVETTVEVESGETTVRGVYPSAAPYNASYPDGDYGTAFYEPMPWTSVEFPGSDVNVTGIWRFYTARDTDWETLNVATDSGARSETSVALPVYVHGFPSTENTTVTPTGNATEVVRVWGPETDSPADTIGENVRVGVVPAGETYTPSYGVAIRGEGLDRGIRVNSLLSDTPAAVVNLTKQTSGVSGVDTVETARTIRNSNLTVEVVDSSEDSTTLRIELTDNVTGSPIDLDEEVNPLAASRTERPGYVTVNGERVTMDQPGVATITVQETGTFRVRYHPASWVVAEPAYSPDRAAAKHQPLDTGTDVINVLNEVALYLVPVIALVLMARRIRKILPSKRR